MATPTEASNLANVSRCYNTCIPPGSQWSVVIYLLALISGIPDPMSSETASLLANRAKCMECIPPGNQLGVIIYLLDAIITGGGGGGALFGITVAAGPPPIDGSITTLFYKDSVSNSIWINSGTVANPTWDPV